MLKIFNYILIIFLFFFNIALAEKIKVFEFTENELSKLKVIHQYAKFNKK